VMSSFSFRFSKGFNATRKRGVFKKIKSLPSQEGFLLCSAKTSDFF
jgi:hypothetical protein